MHVGRFYHHLLYYVSEIRPFSRYLAAQVEDSIIRLSDIAAKQGCVKILKWQILWSRKILSSVKLTFFEVESLYHIGICNKIIPRYHLSLCRNFLTSYEVLSQQNKDVWKYLAVKLCEVARFLSSYHIVIVLGCEISSSRILTHPHV